MYGLRRDDARFDFVRHLFGVSLKLTYLKQLAPTFVSKSMFIVYSDVGQRFHFLR